MSSISIGSSPRDRGAKAFVSRNGDESTRQDELDLLLVDDDLAARYNVWALLRFRRDVGAIHIADSAVEALALAKRHRPHVCLISATLGHREALTLACGMKHLVYPPRVLIFAAAIDAQLTAAAILAGADGVLWRYADPEQQAGVIKRAATGEQHFPAMPPNGMLELLDRVEDRDRAIVAMLLEHTHPDEIARTLGISARALRQRCNSILTRLEAPSASNRSPQDEPSQQNKPSLSDPTNCQRRSRFPIADQLTARA
jgi:DNA-binding NarL/FixJ family response regulator